MSSLELLSLIGVGVVLLVLYTWFVIDVAATVAIKRLTQDIEDADQDVVDELDDMWDK